MRNTVELFPRWCKGCCGEVCYGLSLQDAIARGIDLSCTVAIVGVDNNPSRVVASRFFRQMGIPLIITAVSADASHGYVFVQEVREDKACFGCVFPDSINDETWPCYTPAVKDILKVVGGMVLYAVDSLLMSRYRCWNLKTVNLTGSIPGYDWEVPKRPGCELCGGAG